MLYAQFYHLSTGWNGTDFSGPQKPIPMPGSDGSFPLDGRKAIRNLITDAKARAKVLNDNLNMGVVGLRIYRKRKGSIGDDIPVTKYMTL